MVNENTGKENKSGFWPKFWAVFTVVLGALALALTAVLHIDDKITGLSEQVSANSSAIASLTSTVNGIDRRVVSLESNLNARLDQMLGILTQGMNIVSPSPAEPALKE